MHVCAIEETNRVGDGRQRRVQANELSRVPVLRELVRNDTREVAGWAMAALAKSDDPVAGKYLDGLAEKPDPTLPVAALVALDEVLAKRKGTEWMASKPRLAQFRSWVDTKQSEEDALSILGCIFDAYRGQHLAGDLAVDYFRTAAENRLWPWSSRRRAIFGVGSIAASGVDNDAAVAAYEWLFDRIRKDDEIEVRWASAYSLRNFVTLFPPQIKAIEEYLPKETDKEVKATLTEAVKKAKEMK